MSHARAPVQARALWPSVAYVSTTASGQPLGSRNIHRSLAQLCKRAGIVPAISHYELRHTAITFQCEARYTTRQIADWAGTSERMISDVYRHKLDDESPLGPAT